MAEGESGEGAPAAAASKWYESALQVPENRGLAELKGWKGPDDAFTSYRNLERLKGVPENELLRIPKADDEAAWEAFHARLRPEKPEGYGDELAPAEGAADLRALAHKYGLTQRQAKGLAGELAALTKGHSEAQEARLEAAREADLGALKTEWGAEYEANIQAGQRARKHLGWDEPTMDKLEQALGLRGTLELAARIGRGIREDGMPGGQAAGGGQVAAEPFGLTRTAALARFNQMNADPAFKARLMSADKKTRLEAVEERRRVAQIAFDE